MRLVLALAAAMTIASASAAAPAVDVAQPGTVEVKVAKIKAFAFAGGRTGPLKLGYRTLGTPHKGADGQVDNAVLLLHGTGGDSAAFLGARAALLFGPGAPLDIARTFVILPDGIGSGASSRPGEAQGVNFPHYDYSDMVRAERAIVRDTLGVGRLRLILGVSMGAMHAWTWATDFPAEADTIVALGAWPVAVGGRNLLWRLTARDALLASPLPGGTGARVAAGVTMLANVPAARLGRIAPDAAGVRTALDAATVNMIEPIDLAFQLDAVRTYDPSAKLDRITAHVVALNFADDPLYPPENDPLPAIARRLPRIATITVPASDRTIGHATLGDTAVWLPYVEGAIRAALAR